MKRIALLLFTLLASTSFFAFEPVTLAAEVNDPIVARVQADADQARICRQLTSLKTDLALGVNLKSYRLSALLAQAGSAQSAG